MHIGGCLNRVERRKLIISIENTTPRGSCRREINSSPLNVRHPPSNVSSNLLFYPIVTCLGYRYICAHYARRCHPLKTELNPARATVPTLSFHYSSSRQSRYTMSYHLSTHRSMIFTTERHNLYSTSNVNIQSIDLI